MYKKPFNIALPDLQKWYEETETIYCSDSVTGLRLVCSLRGGFKITHKGTVMWQGMQPTAAVDKYNELSDELTNKN